MQLGHTLIHSLYILKLMEVPWYGPKACTMGNHSYKKDNKAHVFGNNLIESLTYLKGVPGHDKVISPW